MGTFQQENTWNATTRRITRKYNGLEKCVERENLAVQSPMARVRAKTKLNMEKEGGDQHGPDEIKWQHKCFFQIIENQTEKKTISKTNGQVLESPTEATQQKQSGKQ